MPQPTLAEICPFSPKTPIRPKPLGEYVPDKSQERNLSTDSTPSTTSIKQLDKKHRSDSEFDYPQMEPEQDVTLSDIMA